MHCDIDIYIYNKIEKDFILLLLLSIQKSKHMKEVERKKNRRKNWIWNELYIENIKSLTFNSLGKSVYSQLRHNKDRSTL